MRRRGVSTCAASPWNSRAISTSRCLRASPQEGNPGYSNIRVRVDVDSDADADALQALHEHVVRTSPILTTVARPVNVTTELRIAGQPPAESAAIA